MERSNTATALRRLAPGGAALLTVLRFVTLKTAFDENGLLPKGSLVLPLTVLTAALLFGGLWLLCLRLNRLPGTERCFSEAPGWLFVKLAGGVLVFFGGVLVRLETNSEPDLAETLAAWGGMLAGLLMIVTAIVSKRGAWVFWARLLPALYTGAALVLRFRDWSHDPLVIHILPLLLAWTCCMVEMMLLMGFPLGAGHRRSGVLFGLATGCFTCMALPDFLLGLQSSLPELLPLLGLSLWCVAAALELLRKPVQEEQATTDKGQLSANNGKLSE